MAPFSLELPAAPVPPPAPHPDGAAEHHAQAWMAGWRAGWIAFQEEAFGGGHWPPFRRGWNAGRDAARLAAEGREGDG